MQKIHLHSTSVRNDGSYVDAGETVGVGNGATQIAAERAKDLVDQRRAIVEAAAKKSAPKKPASRKPAAAKSAAAKAPAEKAPVPPTGPTE